MIKRVTFTIPLIQVMLTRLTHKALFHLSQIKCNWKLNNKRVLQSNSVFYEQELLLHLHLLAWSGGSYLGASQVWKTLTLGQKFALLSKSSHIHPPQKSEPMPTWSTPATLRMWLMWSVKSCCNVEQTSANKRVLGCVITLLTSCNLGPIISISLIMWK